MAAAAAFAPRVIGRTLSCSPAAFSFPARPLSPAFRRSPIRSHYIYADFKPVKIQREDTVINASVLGREDAPGIVMLKRNWFGDAEIKNYAEKISQHGFRALIPDLYRGKELLDWPRSVKDIQASVNWLKEKGSKKVGVAGVSIGAALAIASSVLIPEVDAVVAFYGQPPCEFADPARAGAPVQAHFGELDEFVGFSDAVAAKALEEKLKASGVPYEVHTYPGNGHSFLYSSRSVKEMRENMGTLEQNEAAVRLAWDRFTSWMTSHLCP